MLISIDDHELVNLRRIADEVFGQENHVANLIWEKGRKNDAKLVSVGHESHVQYPSEDGYILHQVKCRKKLTLAWLYFETTTQNHHFEKHT